MFRIFVRRSADLSYLSDDRALELDGLRDGSAAWLPRGGTVDFERVAQRLRASPRSRVVGFDVVVAAPRPVSILLALDEHRAPEVVRAHREAVASALEYLDERAAVVRSRRGGGDEEEASSWADPVSFTHGVNRHGEPHLHDHLVLPAVAVGETRMNDPRALFAHAATADALYRSTLRALVGERTGYRVWRSHTGREGVEGMDEGWIALWGGHWSDRGTKQYWEREEIVERWRNQARGVEYFGEMRSPSRLVGIDSHAYRAALDGDRWPTRREIVRALAESARDGLTSQQVTTTVDRLFPEITLERGRRESFLGLHDTWSRVASHARQIDVHERERSGESRSTGGRERGGRERERESEELHRGSR